MGTDVYAYTVFGKIINKNDLIKISTIRGCNHDIDTEKKFCSDCGKPVWVEKSTKSLIDSMESNGLSYFYADYEKQEEIILGFQLAKSCGSYSGKQYNIVLLPTPEMSSLLEIFCQANNINFSPQDFKIYTFNYFSY